MLVSLSTWLKENGFAETQHKRSPYAKPRPAYFARLKGETWCFDGIKTWIYKGKEIDISRIFDKIQELTFDGQPEPG